MNGIGAIYGAIVREYRVCMCVCAMVMCKAIVVQTLPIYLSPTSNLSPIARMQVHTFKYMHTWPHDHAFAIPHTPNKNNTLFTFACLQIM